MVIISRIDPEAELILGLVATIGTDVDGVIKNIMDHLKLFKYSVKVISVSEKILSQFDKTDHVKQLSEHNRISHYMDLGNQIREQTGDGSILMKGVSSFLYKERIKDQNGNAQPTPKTAYIIKSLKHPDEVEFMRTTYGDGFHLIGITSSTERRKYYLVEHKGIPDSKASELIERDSDEESEQGQHTRDTFQHSDYFLHLDQDSDKTHNTITRLIDLLFGDPFITPNFDEYAMFMAYSSSLRSADLSRQIGAVITNNNEILSTGANDCPKFGGGLYWPILKNDGRYEDEPNGRDYMLGFDSNKKEQQNLIQKIFEEFNIDDTIKNNQRIKKTGIGDLTEFGRVVHGEMEALLSCARNNISCRGATLYATTFPCHNCAKHIIAAGIKRVVYIEPYPKSKALQFYKTEIKDSDNLGAGVNFEPFNGIGPKKFIDLFAVSSSRWYPRTRKQKDGNKINWNRNNATLRTPSELFTYLEWEQLATLAFEEEISQSKEINNE